MGKQGHLKAFVGSVEKRQPGGFQEGTEIQGALMDTRGQASFRPLHPDMSTVMLCKVAFVLLIVHTGG